MLKAGMSRLQVPMKPLNFFSVPNPDNLTAIYDPFV
jgi:hypothetical protein